MRNDLPGTTALRIVAEIGGVVLSLLSCLSIGCALMFVAWLLGRTIGL